MTRIEELKQELARHERVLEDAFWADRLTWGERQAKELAERRIPIIEKELKELEEVID